MKEFIWWKKCVIARSALFSFSSNLGTNGAVFNEVRDDSGGIFAVVRVAIFILTLERVHDSSFFPLGHVLRASPVRQLPTSR